MTAPQTILENVNPVPQFHNLSAPSTTENQTKTNHVSLFGEDGFTFFDFLDIINPLQHLPFISNIYRSITGDEIDPGSKIAGATIFGGPLGGVFASMDLAITRKTGQDMAGHATTFFTEGLNTGSSPSIGQQKINTNSEFSKLSNQKGVISVDSQTVSSSGVTSSTLENPIELDSNKKFKAAGMTAIPIPSPDSRRQVNSIFQTSKEEKLGKSWQHSKSKNEQVQSSNTLSPRFSELAKDSLTNVINANKLSYFQNISRLKGSKTDIENNWVADAMLTGLNKYKSAINLTEKPERKRVFINN